MKWKLYAWLKRGKRRFAVLTVFAKESRPLTINDIRAQSKIAISQASLTVSELLKQGLLTCKNPSDKIGRLFVISTEGKELVNSLKGITNES